MKSRILLLISIFLINIIVYSQEDSVLSVDYSKVTLSTDIIPQWKVQTEVGGSSQYNTYEKTFNRGTVFENTVNYYNLRMSIPTLAFRVGIFRNVELRLGLVFMQEFHITKYQDNIISISTSRDNGIYGGAPIEAGVKIKVFEENKYLPSAAVKADIFIPAGNFYFHMDYVSPVFRLMLSKNLSRRFSIGANAGYGWNVYDYFTDKYGSYSVSVNAAISSKLGAFAEAFSYFQYKQTPDHRLGAGLTYRFSRNVMTVVHGGFGISERSPDIFGSGGIGFLFP